jgi:hypothetical protein
MTTHAVSGSDESFENDRTGTILGVAGGVLGGGAILFFWSMGAIGLLGGNGGYVQDLALTGAWRTLFLFYPFVFAAALVVGGVLVALRRDLEAVGAFGFPVVAAVGYYLALIHLRVV